MGEVKMRVSSFEALSPFCSAFAFEEKQSALNYGHYYLA
jgi:hypothetical protein